MPVPKAWKKDNTYGKIYGGLLNMGYSKEAAKSKVEGAMSKYKRKHKK